ncbi:MAG: hypothetical protein D6710_11170 [Nitrospirae bacterium]|nr:MAG: hypothetical protein D6710_11170 [Nitrospirota bacterium]
MKIKYSIHLKHRLVIRNIDNDLPDKIFRESRERFFDTETGHLIAVKKVELYGKIRDVMIAYIREGNTVKILTIHPLKHGQKWKRVKSGRWRKTDERI